jgi:hypothetical protein
MRTKVCQKEKLVLFIFSSSKKGRTIIVKLLLNLKKSQKPNELDIKETFSYFK